MATPSNITEHTLTSEVETPEYLKALTIQQAKQIQELQDKNLSLSEECDSLRKEVALLEDIMKDAKFIATTVLTLDVDISDTGAHPHQPTSD